MPPTRGLLCTGPVGDASCACQGPASAAQQPACGTPRSYSPDYVIKLCVTGPSRISAKPTASWQLLTSKVKNADRRLDFLFIQVSQFFQPQPLVFILFENITMHFAKDTHY